MTIAYLGLSGGVVWCGVVPSRMFSSALLSPPTGDAIRSIHSIKEVCFFAGSGDQDGVMVACQGRAVQSVQFDA